MKAALLVRMLLLSYLYDLSERQTERAVNENIPMKFFVGLAVDESAPDPSTLSAFKARLKANGHEPAFERIVQEIVRVGQEQGKQLCTRRGVEAEAVFGRLKQNWGFRRFILRGPERVEVEWGLLCMAHNMAKLAV
ncbi:MAG: transposase [Anaerolineae bacterium]